MSMAEAAAALVRARAGTDPFACALVLGTGLGPVADELSEAVHIPYADLPGFPQSDITGHAMRLSLGWRGAKRVACLVGRAHYYERGDSRAMGPALETLARLGIGDLVLTNAAGSLRADLVPGALALVTDHINYSGLNPLVGSAGDGGFVPMVDAYDPDLRARLAAAAARAEVALGEGVYMWFSGPSFETPAEVRMARMLGADLVGMSTVPEVILARWLGLRVAAVSVVTNYAAGFHGGAPTHAETKEVALRGGLDLRRLIGAFLDNPEATS